MSDFQSRRITMVDTQVRPSDVTKYPILDAMLTVAREDFVPDSRREAAYADDLVDLGNGRVMLEPRAFAKILEALDIQPSDVVLDLGVGLGYSAAIIARMAEFVVAVEEDASLAGEAEERLGAAGVDNVAVITAPLVAGDAKHGPYDVIVVEGAVEELPHAILDQLKEGGRLAAIFLDGNLGTVRIGHMVTGRVHWKYAFNATAPLLPGFAKAHSFAL